MHQKKIKIFHLTSRKKAFQVLLDYYLEFYGHLCCLLYVERASTRVLDNVRYIVTLMKCDLLPQIINQMHSQLIIFIPNFCIIYEKLSGSIVLNFQRNRTCFDSNQIFSICKIVAQMNLHSIIRPYSNFTEENCTQTSNFSKTENNRMGEEQVCQSNFFETQKYDIVIYTVKLCRIYVNGKPRKYSIPKLSHVHSLKLECLVDSSSLQKSSWFQ